MAKNKDDIPSDAPLELLDDAEARYVSRRPELEGALRVTGLDVSGQWCLDVGQSTGSFTGLPPMAQRGWWGSTWGEPSSTPMRRTRPGAVCGECERPRAGCF